MRMVRLFLTPARLLHIGLCLVLVTWALLQLPSPRLGEAP